MVKVLILTFNFGNLFRQAMDSGDFW